MNNKEWFRNAKFGMMVHFGLYSLLGGEWKGKRLGMGEWEGAKPILGEWIQSYYRIPNAEYHQLMNAFNPICFDAEEWVKTAKDAGMEYIVVTSKHHEGYALFDSKVSDYNIAKSAYKKDLLEELAEACYKHSLKMGLYYSQALDWEHPHGGGWTAPNRNLMVMSWTNDWDFPDNDKKDYSICFKEKIVPQVTEILKKFKDLCLIWFDTPHDISPEQSQFLYDLVKMYQPDCLVNSRIGNGKGDYMSGKDNGIDMVRDGDMLCEVPATLNDTWGYKSFDNNWKNAEKLYEIKTDLNSRGINYLLNVGPDGLGRIPAPSVEILKRLGSMNR